MIGMGTYEEQMEILTKAMIFSSYSKESEDLKVGNPRWSLPTHLLEDTPLWPCFVGESA